jgi:hypothetical protein
LPFRFLHKEFAPAMPVKVVLVAGHRDKVAAVSPL